MYCNKNGVNVVSQSIYGTAHTAWRRWTQARMTCGRDGVRFHHAAQSGMQFKPYERCISGTFHLILSDHGWSQVTETAGGEDCCVPIFSFCGISIAERQKAGPGSERQEQPWVNAGGLARQARLPPLLQARKCAASRLWNGTLLGVFVFRFRTCVGEGLTWEFTF